MQGTVRYYNRTRAFGKIISADIEGDVFVHRRVIEDQNFKYLVDGEPVEFEARPAAKGPEATSVRRTQARFSGVVERFDNEKGFGRIISNDGYVELFVHYSDIVSEKGFKRLDEGEAVDFIITKDGKKFKARLVTTDGRSPLERFAVLPQFDDRLTELVELAQSEDWNYKHTPSTRHLPILYSYLHYTFKRIAEEENKIGFAENEQNKQKLAAFNTGLVTKHYEPIFAVFHANTHKDADSPWVLIGFFEESQAPMTYFATHPERANYFDDPTELLYDRRLKLVKNVTHIIEDRIARFPKHFQENGRNLPAILNMAVEQAEKRVAANYKTAIPVFNHGKVQLLLPLCLEDPRRADLALVVGREGAVYKGYTILTLDQAYNNARLLTRPDDEWLVP